MKTKMFLTGLCLLACCSLARAAAPEQPSEMNWTRRPVPFSHQAHFTALSDRGSQEELCVLCHHPVEGRESFLTCATEGCHDELNPKDKSVQSYFQATHKKKTETFHSCVSCHEQAAGSDTGRKKRLAGCKDSACHPF